MTYEHIGIILKEEFLEPFGLSYNSLARAIGVPANCIWQIVKGQRRITAQIDLRLCYYFGLSEGYFLRIQNSYDTLQAKQNIDLSKIYPLERSINLV